MQFQGDSKTILTCLFVYDKIKMYLHNFLIKTVAFRVIVRGNSMASIPFRMILYVFIGSAPVNGGVPVRSSNISTPSDQ